MNPEQLARLHKVAFTKERPWSANEFSGLLNSPHVFAVGNDRSFAFGRAIAGEVELLTLATDPDWQRQGFAQRCLDAFHQEARARQAKTAILEVAVDNDAACRLYFNNGYTTVSERTAYYQRTGCGPTSAWIMSRSMETN